MTNTTILFIVLASFLAADIIAAVILTIYAERMLKKEAVMENGKAANINPVRRTESVSPAIITNPSAGSAEIPQRPAQAEKVGPAKFGKTHNIGRRSGQQDSFGKIEILQGAGIMAVVADGMGGLTGGDQIGQHIVMGMLSRAVKIAPGSMDGVLQQMVREVNDEINAMLGPERLYKSGSTLLAVLSDGNSFHWIAVGDSRIYLFRDKSMIQINHEHTQLQEWMADVIEGKMTYAQAVQNPDRGKLTSFIGMGKLKYVDCSLRSVRLMPGDRLLLMSDGVFNTLSEKTMTDILARYQDVQQAANMFEQAILEANLPAQDNFTAAILGF